ncbi:hypothetical protein LTR86_000081 [Recurvomyces mirabilis]|nr:hypothetical protein LTR86_000081 [Recurvomyces mirabilis]
MRFTEDINYPPPPYMYSCTIEADAKVWQKKDGGMESIKKAFRSMFGRKKREQMESRMSTTTTTVKSPSGQATESARSDPLPPTHPLVSRREAEKRLSSVPQGQRDLGPRGYRASVPAAASNTLGLAQENIHPAIRNSPPRMGEHAVGSALTSDRRESRGPAPPPKDDGVADAVVAAPPEAAAAAPAVTEAQPAHIESTGEPEAEPQSIAAEPQSIAAEPQSIAAEPQSIAEEPLTSMDPVEPLNIVKTINPAAVADTDPAEQTTTIEPLKENVKPNGTPALALYSDDKMLVDEEHPPPAIKPIKAAPGMSATSGPLEDFPEGEFR